MSEEYPDHIEPCPFCHKALTIKPGMNPLGRCDTPDCWMHRRAYAIPLDDPEQVRQWNACATGKTPAIGKAAPEAGKAADVRQIIFDALDLSPELRKECTADVVSALSVAGIIPSSMLASSPIEEVTPEMIAAGWRELKRARWPHLGQGPGLIEAYRAMRAAAKRSDAG